MSVSVEGQTSCAGEGQCSPAPRQALSRVRLDERRAHDLKKISVPRYGTDLASRFEAENHLIRLCRHMRKLGLARDHSYDIGLHTSVLYCLDLERREIAILKAQTEEIAA